MLNLYILNRKDFLEDLAVDGRIIIVIVIVIIIIKRYKTVDWWSTGTRVGLLRTHYLMFVVNKEQGNFLSGY